MGRITGGVLVQLLARRTRAMVFLHLFMRRTYSRTAFSSDGGGLGGQPFFAHLSCGGRRRTTARRSFVVLSVIQWQNSTIRIGHGTGIMRIDPRPPLTVSGSALFGWIFFRWTHL